MEFKYSAVYEDTGAAIDSEMADTAKNITARLLRRTKQYGNEAATQWAIASVLAIAETKDIKWLKSKACRALLNAAGFDTEYLYSVINKKTREDIKANYTLDNYKTMLSKIDEIKEEYSKGVTVNELAKKHGVLVNTLRKAVTGCMASQQVLDKYQGVYPLFIQKYNELQSIRKVIKIMGLPERAAFGLYQKMLKEKQL